VGLILDEVEAFEGLREAGAGGVQQRVCGAVAAGECLSDLGAACAEAVVNEEGGLLRRGQGAEGALEVEGADDDGVGVAEPALPVAFAPVVGDCAVADCGTVAQSLPEGDHCEDFDRRHGASSSASRRASQAAISAGVHTSPRAISASRAAMIF
jgi:hypothetical protein